MQFAWLKSNLPYAEHDNDTFARFPAWHFPIMQPYSTSFLTRQLLPKPEYVVDMQWADGSYDDSVPFWVWLYWGMSDSMMVDMDDKSLCFSAASVGCLLPYAPKFKNDAALYALPKVDSDTLHKLSSDDIVFPVALSSDGEFYQVIVFPQMQGITKQKTAEDAYEYMDSLVEQGRVPLNGFVKKSVIKKLNKGNPLTKIDPNYSDAPVFFTLPFDIDFKYMDEEKRAHFKAVDE